MVARVFAFLAAGAMVLAALQLRGSFHGSTTNSEPLRLTCTTELADVCTAIAKSGSTGIEITIEPAGTTASRLIGEKNPGLDDPLDGWLAPRLWIELVREQRGQVGATDVIGPPSASIARSPLVLVAAKDRASALAMNCAAGQIDWRCLGDAAQMKTWSKLKGGNPGWGPVKIGIPDPNSASWGPLALGALTTGYFDRLDFDAVDLDDGSNGYGPWLGAVAQANVRAAGGNSQLTTLLTAGPAAYDAVVSSEAEAVLQVDASARKDQMQVIYPAPMITCDLSLAGALARHNSGRLLSVVRSTTSSGALARYGWRVPGRPLSRELDQSFQLPPSDGLPSAGVLEAIRSRWQQ